MSAAQELDAYLHDNIPLTRAIGVKVVAADCDGVRLCAPFGPNVNHRRTVFGGSLTALAVLAGWAVVRTGLLDAGVDARIVVQRQTMEFLQPVTGGFEARCAAPEPARWRRFLAGLERRGRARIGLAVQLSCDGADVARGTADYVAERND